MVDLIFLCLARDCARTIPAFLAFASQIRALGRTVSVVIGENGSSDGTGELLKRAAAAGEIMFVDTSAMAGHAHRLERMAHGREMLKERLAHIPPARLVCVADVDAVMAAPPDATAFLAAAEDLLGDDRLFAAAATSEPYYYDLLALDADGESFDDLQDRIYAARTSLLRYYRFFRENIYPVQKRLSQKLPKRCISAFNGLCVYKYEDYIASSYLSDHAQKACEHLVFNRRIAARTGGSIRIDRRIVLRTPLEHSPQSLPFFAWTRLAKVAKARLGR